MEEHKAKSLVYPRAKLRTVGGGGGVHYTMMKTIVLELHSIPPPFKTLKNTADCIEFDQICS